MMWSNSIDLHPNTDSPIREVLVFLHLRRGSEPVNVFIFYMCISINPIYPEHAGVNIIHISDIKLSCLARTAELVRDLS
jgi:hypothetical protein